MIKINNKDVVDVYKPNIIKGSPNLLKGANVELKSKNYLIGGYIYDVKPIVGKTYTLTLCYKCGERTNYIAASHYNGSLYNTNNFTSKIKTIESKVFTIIDHGNLPRDIHFYNLPYLGSGQDGNYNDDTVIYWALLQEGDVGIQKEFIPATSEFPNGIIVPEFTNNLLIGSKTGYNMTGSDFKDNTEFSSEINTEGFFEFTIKSLVVANNQQYRYKFVETNLAEYFIDGEEYTFSAEVKCTAPCRIKIDSRDNKMVNIKPIQINFPNTNGQWQRLKTTVRLTDLKDNTNSLLLFGFLDSAPINATATVRKICLTKGNNANEWTPNIDEIIVPVKKIYKGNELMFEKKTI